VEATVPASNSWSDSYKVGAGSGHDLQSFQGQNHHSCVLGLSGPGLAQAASLARSLDLPLLAWSVQRVRLRGQRRTVGCLAPGGVELWNHDQLRRHDLALADLQQEIAHLYEAMHRQQRQLLRRNPCQPSGRHLIVVDECIGSGLVIRAALMSLRLREPASITLAAPLSAAAGRRSSAPLTLSQLVKLLQQSTALPSERALAMPPSSSRAD